MTLRKKALALVGASALAFTMAGCSGISLPWAGATSDGPDAPAARPTSPLNQLLEGVWGSNLSQEEQQRQIDEQAMRREEYIAQCMNEAGFEYIPRPDAGGTIIIDDGTMWQPDNREWVTQWGYGAVNSPHQAQWDAEREAIDAGEMEAPTWFDPNQEYMDSLSESELQAFQLALWGPPMDQLPEGVWNSETGEILDMETFNLHQGCSGQAWNQIDSTSSWQITQQEEFRPLMEAMNDVWMNVQNDPEMAAIDRDWSSCMADAGFAGFNRQVDAQNSIWDEWSEIQNNFDWNSWNWDTNPQGPNIRQTPEAVALADREVNMALADLDCRESVNLRDRQDAIQFAAENQFINDHRAALDALLAAVEQGR